MAHKEKLSSHKPRVLIVHHGNSYCQVYSDDPAIEVRIVNVPMFRSAWAELAIEELIGLRLPHVWGQVIREGKLLKQDAIKDLCMDNLVKRNEEITLCRILSDVAINASSEGTRVNHAMR
jgi:hypothetical protein